MGVNLGILHIVKDIQRSQDGRQEHEGNAQLYRMGLPQGFQAVPDIAPGADDRGRRVRNGHLVHREVGACEEGTHGRSHQEWRQQAVDHEGYAEAFYTQQVAFLVLKFIGHGLEYER